MHYANGRVAKIGDLVRGRGYNLKHEFTGILVAAKPEESSCNCTVVTVSINSLVRATLYAPRHPSQEPPPSGWFTSRDIVVQAEMEYGQLDAFVAIDPATGEVLPPES